MRQVRELEQERQALAERRIKLAARRKLRANVEQGFEGLHMRSLRRLAHDREARAKASLEWADRMLSTMKARQQAALGGLANDAAPRPDADAGSLSRLHELKVIAAHLIMHHARVLR